MGVAIAIAGFFPVYFFQPSLIIRVLSVWSTVAMIVLPFYYIGENELMRRLRRRDTVQVNAGALRRNLNIDAVSLGIYILFLLLLPVLSLYLSYARP